MEKLEVLLNRLMDWGWKPRGIKKILHITIYDCDLNVYLDGGFLNEDKKSFRELVSKESGLWQFVCDKGLVKKDGDINKDMEKYMYKCEYMDGCGNTINYWKRSKFTHHYFYEYFIIESALCDEDKLEEFLLSNIKINGTTK